MELRRRSPTDGQTLYLKADAGLAYGALWMRWTAYVARASSGSAW